MNRMRKPLQTLLIKPAGPDCNMACTYCFYLEKASLFPESPKPRMSQEVLEEVVRQAMEQSGSQISFIWQGGEPMLMGLEFYRKCIAFQQRFGRGQTVGNGLQTNGLLMDAEWVRFLKSYNWLVGLSLDGPQHVHDHYRRTRGGAGTWKKVTASAERMLAADLAVNTLIVVNDYTVQFPDEIYAFHKNLGLSHMQFVPCVEPDKDDPSRVSGFSVPAEGYGRFLCRLFDLWMDDFSGLQPATSVRLFESLFHAYMGNPPPECTLLDVCGTYVVVEHNGDVFSCDFFVHPAWRLGNVKDSRLWEMLNAERQCVFGRRKANLPHECNGCRWLSLCRGGCPKDRFPGLAGEALNHLCSAYRMFFEYSDERFRRLVKRWERQHPYSAMQAEDRTGGRPPDFKVGGKVGRKRPCPTTQDRMEYCRFYAYLHSVVDRHIAAVLDKLDKKGLTDDTIIFRFADHGEQSWSHQMIQKGLNSYQETINVPLIISNPKLFPKGTTTSSFASLVDLVPTIAEITGAASPKDLTRMGICGKSLVPVMQDPNARVRDNIMFYSEDFQFFFNEYLGKKNTFETIPGKIRSIRFEDWMYAVYFTDKGTRIQYEMYNLTDDPGEMTNLAWGSRRQANLVRMQELHDMLTAELTTYQALPDGFQWPAKAGTESV